jgi:hypothetical protein
MVLGAFPSILALAIVLSICSWNLVSCWGRRIATDSPLALVILSVGWLEWFSVAVSVLGVGIGSLFLVVL